MKKYVFVVIAAMVLVSLSAMPLFSADSDEKFTVTTYYPSPYGVYKQLRVFPYDEAGVKDGDPCPDKEGTLAYDLIGHQLLVCSTEAPETVPVVLTWMPAGGGEPPIPPGGDGLMYVGGGMGAVGDLPDNTTPDPLTPWIMAIGLKKQAYSLTNLTPSPDNCDVTSTDCYQAFGACMAGKKRTQIKSSKKSGEYLDINMRGMSSGAFTEELTLSAWADQKTTVTKMEAKPSGVRRATYSPVLPKYWDTVLAEAAASGKIGALQKQATVSLKVKGKKVLGIALTDREDLVLSGAGNKTEYEEENQPRNVMYPQFKKDKDKYQTYSIEVQKDIPKSKTYKPTGVEVDLGTGSEELYDFKITATPSLEVGIRRLVVDVYRGVEG